MAQFESPPFARGKTFFDGGTTDATSGAPYEGKEYLFEDIDWGSTTVGAKPVRTQVPVRCRVVRNVSGIALLPKRAVVYKGANWGRQVDGYAIATAGRIDGVVDEFLPTAGVPANDLFYIVVHGPTNMLPDLAAGANNVINVGDPMINLTAANSTSATTGGRVYSWNSAMTFTSTQTTDGTAGLVLLNVIGRALTARTTANTTLDVLVDLRRY